jgi:hypothetical protein
MPYDSHHCIRSSSREVQHESEVQQDGPAVSGLGSRHVALPDPYKGCGHAAEEALPASGFGLANRKQTEQEIGRKDERSDESQSRNAGQNQPDVPQSFLKIV